jgi:O-acetyl-ADP-ribose deacetylase (regulator of RNase III)
MEKTYQLKIRDGAIHIVQGDITEMDTDAIVNAANEHLILGAGVAGAIKRKGGPSIQEECDRIGGTFVGGAVITGAGNLPVKYVIHAVGPRMGEGNEDEKLKNAVLNSFKLAEENKLTSISLPAISTGIFGYPIERCALIMINEAKIFLGNSRNLNDIYFVLWDNEAYTVFLNTIKEK